MNWKRQSYPSQPLKSLALELESLFAEQASLFNHAHEEKRANDYSRQTLQGESNREFVSALPEVQAYCDDTT